MTDNDVKLDYTKPTKNQPLPPLFLASLNKGPYTKFINSLKNKGPKR